MENFSVDAVLDILRRRRWLAIALLSLGLTATVSVVLFLPSIYTARAFILVEGQQIPENFVRSTVTTAVETRIYTLSREILSRQRLESLISTFNLYEDLRKRASMDQVIAQMRSDIGIEIRNVDVRGRHDSAAVAFALTYGSPDAQKAAKVTNALGSFYIEENLKARERQAAGTTEFVGAQLQEVKKKLEAQEKEISKYKERNLGELPEQVNANMRALERLQMQANVSNDSLARAQERRSILVAQLSDDDPDAPAGGRLSERLEALERELASLRTQFSDKYPDVIRVKQEIATLEQRIKERGDGPDASATTRTAAARTAYGRRLQNELRTLDTEIKIIQTDLARARREAELYQRRIENAPRREQEVSILTRDYNSTRELYASLLKRQEEASLAGTMEQRQKGEQFRILDPAAPPGAPSAPNRFKMLAMGLVATLGLTAAGVLVREKLDTSFHRVEELKAFSSTPVLVTIPRIVTDADRMRERSRRRLGTAALAASLLALVTTSYFLLSGNELLVQYLVRPGGAQGTGLLSGPGGFRVR
jgi:polysaccharide biosynthesis transport protein